MQYHEKHHQSRKECRWNLNGLMRLAFKGRSHKRVHLGLTRGFCWNKQTASTPKAKTNIKTKKTRLAQHLKTRFYEVRWRTMLPVFKDDPDLCSHVLASVRWTACCPVHSMHHGSHLKHNRRTRLGINNTPDTFSLFRMGRRDLSQWHNWKNQTCLWFKTTMRFCVCFLF